FVSNTVTTQLTVQASLLNVDLGNFDTTGYALGNYRVVVTVTDLSGSAIPGGTAETTLLVGSPVSATLTTGPQQPPPGTSTVSNTLEIDSQPPLIAPLGVVGQAAVSGASSTARFGDYVYVAGSQGISVFNVAGANISNPLFVRQVGQQVYLLAIKGN